MKRIVCFCLILACVIGCFAGCGSEQPVTEQVPQDTAPHWEPEQVSDELVPYVKKTIKIIDKYMAGKITATEAADDIEKIGEQMDADAVSDLDNGYLAVERSFALDVKLLSYGIALRLDSELQEVRDNMLYSIGEPVSGKRDYPKPEEDGLELLGTYYRDTDIYDYMCGYEPEDIAEFAKQEIETLNNFADDGIVWIGYSCYGQTVFGISIYKVAGAYSFQLFEPQIDGVEQTEDLFLSLTPAEMEDVILEMASYFTGP